MTEQRLCECLEGVTGVITKVNGSSNLIARLLEMGLLPGQQIRIVRKGNPIIFDVGDSRLCVRPCELDGIHLSPIDPNLMRGQDSVYEVGDNLAAAESRV